MNYCVFFNFFKFYCPNLNRDIKIQANLTRATNKELKEEEHSIIFYNRLNRVYKKDKEIYLNIYKI